MQNNPTTKSLTRSQFIDYACRVFYSSQDTPVVLNPVFAMITELFLEHYSSEFSKFCETVSIKPVDPDKIILALRGE